jgi:uncharacterized protein YajQ (UPF0234 family)
MAKKEHSFDISAGVDMQEIKNALNQAQKEVDNRYDFKGISKDIELNEKTKIITMTSASDNKIDAMLDILISKASKRDISPYALKQDKIEDASGSQRRAFIKVVDTISTEDAKKIVKEIKSTKLKVNSTIQGEEVRVTAKSIDDLQAVIAHLKSLELDLPLKFGNFK